MPLAGRRTAAAGGVDATQTTLNGILGAISDTLTAAGWVSTAMPAGVAWAPSTPYTMGAVVTNSGNRYQAMQTGTSTTGGGPTGTALSITDGTVVWRFLSRTVDNDFLFTSNGESGAESLAVRLWVQTATGTNVNMTMYQFWDGTFGFNRIGPEGNTVTQFSFTAGNTHNYAIVADKDSFVALFNDNLNSRQIIGGGLLIRNPNSPATHFVSNATVTAGANRTYSFASGNPIAAGYRRGDRVFVVSQQANTASPFNVTIPLFAATITQLTTNSITINFAQETTSAGALIGADPQPLWYFDSFQNQTLNAGTVAYCAYRWEQTSVNLFTAGTLEQGYPNASSSVTARPVCGTASAELDPNRRTERVGMGQYVFLLSSREVAGIFPKYFWNPRLTDALWSIARSQKEAVNYDYVTFPANTASPSGQFRETIGPFAVSGGSTYVIDYFPALIPDHWVEADIASSISATDSGMALLGGFDSTTAYPFIARQGDPFQASTLDMDIGMGVDSDGNAVAWAVYLPNIVHQSADRMGRNQYNDFSAGEPLPFDSPVAQSASSGSAFNTGLN
jgi:hypothetical protein